MTDVNAQDGGIDDGQDAAQDILGAAGWRIVDDWRATPSAYVATVERADDEPNV